MTRRPLTSEHGDDLSEAELEHRRKAVLRSRHSAEMEGGRVPPETQADQDEWARGAITEDEMIRRIRERFGLEQS